MLVWNDARVERSKQDEAEALQDLERVLDHLRRLAECFSHVAGEAGTTSITPVPDAGSSKGWSAPNP